MSGTSAPYARHGSSFHVAPVNSVRQAGDVPDIEVRATADVPPAVLDALRALLVAAFGGTFSADDWDHTLGGCHVLVTESGVLVAHAAVVERTLHVDGVPFRTGYVEGVATAPSRQGRGLGTLATGAATDLVRAGFDLGALSTGVPAFYERLGWERWAGPTFVRGDGGAVRTPGEDGGVLVLRHGPSAGVALAAGIACDARSGDDW